MNIDGERWEHLESCLELPFDDLSDVGSFLVEHGVISHEEYDEINAQNAYLYE